MPLTQLERATRFRALHDARETFLIPNPYDVGTARLLESLGFPALTTTSAGFAFTIGRRDGQVTRDEVMAHAKAIVETTEVPVAADLENGYGDAPEIVAETICRAAEAGLVGASIEDATGNPESPIYGLEHAVARIEAAVAAARALPFPFMLVARADSFFHGRPDLEDTIRRLQAFAAAGADVLYAPHLPSLEAVRAVCAAVAPKPVNVLANARFTVADLAAAGARRISVGASLSRAALGTVLAAAREMQERGTFGFFAEAPSYDVLMKRWTQRP